jgi:hypothetical protein
MNSSRADDCVNCLKTLDVSATRSVSILRESDLIFVLRNTFYSFVYRIIVKKHKMWKAVSLYFVSSKGQWNIGIELL